jgi:hypothetical protein
MPTRSTQINSLPPVQNTPTVERVNAFNLINRPLSATEARDISAFSDFADTGLGNDVQTVKSMQNKMKKFGWGSLGGYQGNTNTLNQEMNPEDLNKSGVQSGKTFSLVAPSMISEGLRRAKLMGINSKAAFLENADIIFKGVKDDVRKNQFFKNIAPNFYQVAANIYEDRLRNFVPPSATNAPASTTPTAPVNSTNAVPASK